MKTQSYRNAALAGAAGFAAGYFCDQPMHNKICLGAIGALSYQILFGARKIFPMHLARGISPGYFATQGGSVYLSAPLHKGPIDFFKLDRMVSEQVRVLKAHEAWKEVEAMPAVQAINGKGHEFGFEGLDIRLFVGNDPRKYTNRAEALKFLERTVLQNPQFFKKPTDEIVATLQKTHAIMMRGFPESIMGKGGVFRTDFSFVREEGMPPTQEGCLGVLQKRGGTPKEIRELNKIFQSREVDLNSHISDPAKRGILEKIFYFPPPHQEVPAAMSAFAKELKNRVRLLERGKGDVVEIASWVFFEMTRIHPWADGNGRTARAWMNAIL